MICIIGCLLAVNTLKTNAANKHIIGSYNIRCLTEADVDDKHWDNRKAYFFEMIRFCNFDAFGIQEVTDRQSKELELEMTEYHYIGYGRDNGKENNDGASGEQTGILYKREKYEALDFGRFFVSETPNLASRIRFSAFNRLVAWVELKDKQSGETFFLFSTHLDHPDNLRGRNTRKKQSKIAIQEIKKIAQKKPLFFVGDFNFRDTEPAYKRITKIWQDAYLISETPPKGGYQNTADTYTGLYNNKKTASKRIDFIFVNQKKVKIKTYQAIDDKLGHTTYPSDHLPIFSEVVFK